MNACVLGCTRFRRVAITFLFLTALNIVGARAHTNPPQNPSGAVTTPAGSKFKVLRAVSGTTGIERDGRLIIEDPRTVFHPGQDRKVLVYFEWEGPVGAHKFEGLWKNPSGKVVIVSDFQYEAKKQQFAGYWTMLLDENATTGVWTLEARIDGEAAGSFPFEVTAAPGSSPEAPTRVPLSAAEIYHQAEAATVFVEKLDAAGKQVSRGTGFFVGPGRLLTTFANIDGASGLRVVLPDGRRVNTNQILSWDRWQDWTVLKVEAEGIRALKRASPKSWKVGDHCYALLVSSTGGRVIADGNIVGDTTQTRAGERLSLSLTFDPTSVGAAVLNELGEAVGMLGGSLLPGISPLRALPGGSIPSQPGAQVGALTGLAVPITLINLPTGEATPVTLADLGAKGQFIPLLQAQGEVSFGTLALRLEHKGGPAWARDSRDQFSHGDSQMIVFVNWQPRTKFKGVATLRFYDLDNKKLAEVRPLKVNFRPGDFTSSYWIVSLSAFPAGTYRADISLGDAPAWREFFRVVP